jgi:hypothetical protein
MIAVHLWSIKLYTRLIPTIKQFVEIVMHIAMNVMELPPTVLGAKETDTILM